MGIFLKKNFISVVSHVFFILLLYCISLVLHESSVRVFAYDQEHIADNTIQQQMLFALGETPNTIVGEKLPSPITGERLSPPITGEKISQSGNNGNTLSNPLKARNITELLVQIIDILLTLAIPVVVMFIMYGGFVLVTAQGNQANITKGKNSILWAVIGGVIVLSAKLIIEIIQSTVTALQSS